MAEDSTNDFDLTEDIIDDSIIEDSFEEERDYVKRLSQRFSVYRNNAIAVSDDSDSHSETEDFAPQSASTLITEGTSPDKANSSDVVVVSSDDEVETAFVENSVEEPKTPSVKKLPIEFKKPVAPPNKFEGIRKSAPIPELQATASVTAKKELVTEREYEKQVETVRAINVQLQQAREALRKVNLGALPDKGKLLREKNNVLTTVAQQAKNRLENMEITDEPNKENPSQHPAVAAWDDIQAGLGNVQPKTYGKKGLANYNEQKEMTLERLQSFHHSIENGPREDQFAADPKGLKVELMGHQKSALTWLMWREKQKPSGGILADDMGLGKTLTMISLIAKMNEQNVSDDSDSDDVERIGGKEKKTNKINGKYQGGTLVVCPASLLQQWMYEVESKCKRGLISVELYHGSKRENKPKRLAQHDLVITTYSIIQNEYDCKENRHGPIFYVKFKRIILDEAHQIRNHKSQTSQAVCSLNSRSRWVLTGTPIQNKELDFYALIKFLRCSPFDQLDVWKRWINDKSAGGGERLNTIISSLMLRRTKAELMEKKKMAQLPDRKWDLIEIGLDETETSLYQKVLLFSRTLFAQFLHQKAEKNAERCDLNVDNAANPNAEYFKMREKLLHLNKVKEVSQHHILVLLLRLRQICCHPHLITAMLDDGEEFGDENLNASTEVDLMEQLKDLNLNDDDSDTNIAIGLSNESEKTDLKAAAKGFLNPSNPIFNQHYQSSKIKKCVEIVREKIVGTNDKIVIVSQWKSFLDLITIHLREENVLFDMLCGSVPIHKRMQIIEKINNPKDRTKVLLLSLTAGGVGLNLVGANHLILLDLHWNPQLENQAQDRIYRVGQKKPIFIYKIMVTDTIEQRIQALQQNKLEIANALLTGSKRVIENKLSLDDLKMLFGF